MADNAEGIQVLDPPNTEGASFLTVTDKGEMWYLVDSGQWCELCDDVMAMGSGGDYATGAIAAGASPSKAMKIAHKYDSMTGSTIVRMKL